MQRPVFHYRPSLRQLAVIIPLGVLAWAGVLAAVWYIRG